MGVVPRKIMKLRSDAIFRHLANKDKYTKNHFYGTVYCYAVWQLLFRNRPVNTDLDPSLLTAPSVLEKYITYTAICKILASSSQDKQLRTLFSELRDNYK